MERQREGFAGERLIVLPDAIVKDALKSPLLQSLLPVAAGYFPRSSGHFVERQEPLSEAIIMLCAEGSGWVRVGDSKPQAVHADSFVFIPAGSRHSYGASETEPWSINWAHLKGSEVAGFRQLFQFSKEGSVVALSRGSSAQVDFEPLHQILSYDYTLPSLLFAAAQVRLILSQLFRIQNRYPSDGDTNPIERSIKWMRENLAAKANLGQLANRAGYSIPHYSTRFKARTGFSPIDYFLRIKIQRACRLLDSTGLSVEAVATAVGYEDPFYFSRIFRRIMGKSPRAYRTTLKG